MPGLDGIAAIEQVLRLHPAIQVVFASIHSDASLVDRCLRAGALGFVVKAACGVHLVPAVRAALGGQRYVSLTLDQPTSDESA